MRGRHWRWVGAMLVTLATSLGASAALAQAAGAASDAEASASLQAALAAPHRTPAFVARDAWRHPGETLQFFGVKPGMTVVELSPGAGWYTEILAPLLREQGQLILGANDPESIHAYYRRGAERLKAKLDARPDVYGRVKLGVFEPPARLQVAAPGSVDLMLTFRNVHNWAAEGDAAVLAVFKSVHEALKPGGVFGVVDHRLPADRVQDAKASSGYLHVSYVRRLAESAGLRLEASSEVNANPRDTADHKGGVWALPPTYANKDADRERYTGIGESDRFTLRFVKP